MFITVKSWFQAFKRYQYTAADTRERSFEEIVLQGFVSFQSDSRLEIARVRLQMIATVW